MKLTEVLNRLRSHPIAIERLPLFTTVDTNHELGALISTAESIINASKRPTAPKTDTSGLANARAAWISCHGKLDSLDRRQIRLLCWDKGTVLDPRFINALSSRDDLTKKRVWIEGIISAYFAEWRSMPQPVKLETLLSDTCDSFRGNSVWLANCRKFSDQIFSPKAAEFIGSQIVKSDLRVMPVLEQWAIPQANGLGPASVRAAIEFAVRAFLEDSHRARPQPVIENLKAIFEGLFSFPTLESATFGRAMSYIILSDAAENSSEVQSFIKDYARNNPRLGDPRLPINTAKWNSVGDEARKRFVSWLAQDDLLFFFEHVIRDGDDRHDRKRFWLQYLDHVEDSCVALCYEDKRRLRAETFERLSHSDISDSWDVSAFIMRFRGTRDIIVVEFSKPNNAIYIHKTETFQTVVGHFRTSRFKISTSGGLKDRSSHVERFNHIQPNSRWQSEVRNYLASLGIRLR
jgi:hypothetical protein